ncbi:uncharacterized protein LOC111912554 [Lactuca sativa]|uniref:Uncharacterized protein n=1 Tax=Lactuca sativa TaxID=4236 RepID=A0A9R1VNI2_LACSA|nr:uncharacterized protein LOC111912554 [Lactuca sativa]KAJ0208080.1 hypothetical protein LSAT_V11C500294720 [Lactuca sativa]
MDPNAVVLEISSDEDVGWNDYDGRGIADGGDDVDWLAELLDEVNKGNSGDDSDEVVVVSEVSPSEKPVKKSKLKNSLVDLDDDCVILDKDPDKPVEVRNDNPSNGEDDSDDIVVVSEKGQVACRDYPHPRHLCIKFPFSTTPNQSHCDQCYCYVCDSLAPCVYWGNGSAPMDHCHATDKDELWKHERKNAKNGSKAVQQTVPKVADMALFNGLHPPPPTPTLQMVQPPRSGSIRARHLSANLRHPNVMNQIRRPVFPSRNKLHPDLVSQYLLTRHGGSISKGQHGTQLHVPVFKRTGSVGGATPTPTPNRHHPYAPHPHRGNSGNPNRHQNYPAYSRSLQPNVVNNTPVSYPPHTSTSTSPTVNPLINHQQWPLQPQFSTRCHSNPNNVQSQVNSSLVYRPSSSRPDPTSGQPSYPAGQPVPSQTRVDNPSISVSDYTAQSLPDQGTQAMDNGLSWPATQQSAATVEPDPSSLLAGPGGGGLGDYRYDWIFDNQPVEPGFIDGAHGSYGLTDFSSDSSFIDTGPIFDF